MRKITTKPVNYNGNNTTLNIIEAPKSGKINMPKNSLGYYVGTDGQLYLPVFTYGNIYLEHDTIRDLLWHAIRNVQRDYNKGEDRKTAIFWTRLLYQMHTALVGEYAFDEKLVKAICEYEGLTLLLEVMKEEQVPYKAYDPRITVKVSGNKFYRSDLVVALRQAGYWFCWESLQPDQKFREGMLVHSAVMSLYASLVVGNTIKKYRPELVFEWVNEGRLGTEDEIPMKTIKKMMRSIEIPVIKKKRV